MPYMWYCEQCYTECCTPNSNRCLAEQKLIMYMAYASAQCEAVSKSAV